MRSAALSDILAVLGFFTRLPVSHRPHEGRTFRDALWATPLAGFAVALIGALVFWLADALDVPHEPAAMLALAATILATGCFHEDGLADIADGFGGGHTVERKLEIMKDSRVGSYGAMALILSVGLRWSALSTLDNAGDVLIALVAAHCASRALLPLFLRLVRPARDAGLAAGLNAIPPKATGGAAMLGVVSLTPLGFGSFVVALGLLLSAFLFMRRLSIRQIGGQTGDVCGALQQIAEILLLLLAAATFS